MTTFDLNTIRAYLEPIVTQIEGPYKWYIMGAVAFILTALITRFIFKTFKWFLVMLLVIVLGIGGFYFLMILSLKA